MRFSPSHSFVISRSAIDFDILDPDGNEYHAGKDPLGPIPVKLRIQATAKHANAKDWAKKGREKLTVESYVRIDGGDWSTVCHGEMTIAKLDKGKTIQETCTYTIPDVDTTRIEFRAKIDTDHEIDESDEGDNTSRIESFDYDPQSSLSIAGAAFRYI